MKQIGHADIDSEIRVDLILMRGVRSAPEGAPIMGGKKDSLTAEFVADLAQLEARMTQEHPGVQAVVEAYARAQEGLQQLDTYVRIVNPRPTVITSNGSAT
jgi:hypothetical protein